MRRNARLNIGAVRLQAFNDAADFFVGKDGWPTKRKGDCVEPGERFEFPRPDQRRLQR